MTALAVTWTLFMAALPMTGNAQFPKNLEKDKDLDPVTLHLKWKHGFQFAGYYAALEQGYYREEGLDVTINPASEGFEAINTVLAGDAQYGVWDADLLHERIKGSPVVVLAVIFQHSPYVILSRKDRGIRAPSDLAGCAIMVAGKQGEAQLKAVLVREGLPLALVDIVPHTWSIDDLIDGKVDAAMEYITDEPNRLRMRGVEPAIIRPIDYGIDFYGDCLFTTEEEIKRNPQRTKAFRRASLKGWEYAINHIDELVKLILALPGVQENGLTAKHLQYESEQMQPLIQPTLIEIGHSNPGRWKHMADTYVSLGMMEPGYSLEGFVYEPNPPDDKRWLYALLGSLAGVALVLILAWGWSRQIRRAVVRRTRELHESEKRFKQLANATWEAIVVHEKGIVLEANDQYFEMFGYQREELIGQDGISRTSTPESSEAIRKQVAEGNTGPYEATGKKKNGEEFPMELRVRMMDYHGRQVRVVAIRDLTDRMRAEEALLLLGAAIEQAAEAIVITDVEGIIQYANPAFKQITGYSTDEAIGQNPRILKSGEHDKAFYESMWDTLKRGETWSGQLINKKKDGTLFTEEAVISPVLDGSGRTVNYVAVKHDITGKVKLEEQLRQAQKMEAVGQLAGGIAHDFNNLLQVINGCSELVLESLDEKSDSYASVGDIAKAGARAATLVGQLLAFSRRQVLDIKDVNLNDVIADLMKMIRRMIGEHITLETVAGPDLGTVHADAGQIEQILMNLCVNARDAMPDGGTITIETENVYVGPEFVASSPDLLSGRYVLLSVTDTGCGIDKAVCANIFEPFYTTKNVGEGTGLGLSTVYGLVKQHEGEVKVYSEVGKGTTFKIYLPMASRTAGSVSSKIKSSAPGGTETILLAEDDEMVLHLARIILEQAGYTVLTATDGEEALLVLADRAQTVDLVLLDVIMPRLGGKAVFQKMCSTKHELRYLFASGYSMNAVHTNFILDEGLQLIQKPYSRDELLRRVRGALDE
ncbi:MAG: ABC transporter substrate-binding protein [Gemmatimonadales bacterium]|nr:ABC transporter substrate-binding protein [Gemmatimonadales bacterium]